MKAARWYPKRDIRVEEVPVQHPTAGEVCVQVDYSGEVPTVIALVVDGRINPRPLVTSRIGLGDIVARGIEALASSRNENINTVVVPHGEAIQ